MGIAPKQLMTVDEFLAWSEVTPGRYELLDGVVIEMQAERVRHADVKFAVRTALSAAIKQADAACRMVPDGMTVRIDKQTAFEPDALVYCGLRLPPDAVEVPNPIIVVEVLLPSTRATDFSAKLDGYFRVPSIMHDLIVHPDHLPVIHHARLPDGTILSRIVKSGPIKFDPPGIEISVDGLLD